MERITTGKQAFDFSLGKRYIRQIFTCTMLSFNMIPPHVDDFA